MNTKTPTAVSEAPLALVIPESNLPPSLLSSIEAGFKDAFAQAERWREKALAIKVSDVSQTGEMKLARTIRLELRNIRVSAEKTRRALKEDSLRMGKAIDGVNNLLVAAIAPLERYLEDQEKFGERLLEQQRQELIASRHEALKPFITDGQPLPPLDSFTEDQWTKYLDDARLLHEARIAEAKRIEAERAAREQAEAAERERIRLENERLRKEAAEREEKMAEERRKLEAEKAAAEAKAKAEREAAEAKLRAAEESARKEREAAEAKARAEKAAAEAKAAQERAAREEAERKLAEQQAIEQAERVAEEARKRRAARAPDKTKLQDVAKNVRSITLPELTSAEGKAIAATLAEQIEKFAAWIETQAAKL